MIRKALLLLLLPAAARAYDPISASGFNVEYYEGVVTGSSRIIGMGGAYGAVAEGVAGFPFNPAGLARRYPYSTDWWDYDLALDWLIPGIGTDLDFDNTGLPGMTQEEFIYVLGGFGLQFGGLGLGMYVRGRTYNSAQEVGGQVRQNRFSMVETNLGAAYQVINQCLYVGVGLGGNLLGISELDDNGDEVGLMDISSGFMRVGALLVLDELGWSFGSTFATPALSNERKASDAPADGYFFPDEFPRPWELTLSTAYLFDFGLPKEDRRFVRLALDLLLVGPTDNAISAQGFVIQLAQPAGRDPSLGFRLGAESEVWQGRLQLRCGSYLEPSRFPGRSPRMHFTFGAELKLFELIWEWKLTSAMDVASNYSNTSLGIGFWH